MSRVARSRIPTVAVVLSLSMLVLLWLGGFLADPAAAEEDKPVEAPAADVPEPAIPAPEGSPKQPDPEWSYRFLVPATLLLGTVAVVGAIVMYFVRVTKNRYRVIR